MTPFPPPQFAALCALLDRLIPADDFPGALAAGVEDYMLGQLSGSAGRQSAHEAPPTA